MSPTSSSPNPPLSSFRALQQEQQEKDKYSSPLLFGRKKDLPEEDLKKKQHRLLSGEKSTPFRHMQNETVNKTDIQTAFPFLFPRLFVIIITTFALVGGLQQQQTLPSNALLSKLLFWPTLPFTILKRYKDWVTLLDDDIVAIGGVPLGNLPKRLQEEMNVSFFCQVTFTYVSFFLLTLFPLLLLFP